jgi:hypothetical protein
MPMANSVSDRLGSWNDEGRCCRPTKTVTARCLAGDSVEKEA